MLRRFVKREHNDIYNPSYVRLDRGFASGRGATQNNSVDFSPTVNINGPENIADALQDNLQDFARRIARLDAVGSGTVGERMGEPNTSTGGWFSTRQLWIPPRSARKVDVLSDLILYKSFIIRKNLFPVRAEVAGST